MIKTLTVNISGLVFHIDDNAYQILKSYLDKISQHFKLEESGHEIIADIEQRISELFKERIAGEQDIINIDTVKEVIEVMGMPEDFWVEEEPASVTTESAQKEPYTSTRYKKKSTKLYRDPDSRVIGGVCSGLGYYLNIDKVLLRIIFIILLLFPYSSGPMLLVYIILWIAVPKARTTTQRLEMKGEDVNVGNIEKTVKEDKGERKDSSAKGSGTYNQSLYREKNRRENIEPSNDVANVIMKVFGVLLFIFGFMGLLGLVVGLFATGKFMGVMPHWVNGEEFYLFQHFIPEHVTSTLLISIILIVGMPLLLVIYAGTKLIFRYESNNKSIIFSAVGLWLIGLVIAISSAFGAFDAFSSKASVPEKIEFNQSLPDTLYIEIDQDKFESSRNINIQSNGRRITITNDGEKVIGRPKFDVQYSHENKAHLKLRKESLGRNYNNAHDNADAINYTFKLKDKRLILDPYFTLDDEEQWRQQELYVILRIPEGKVIFLNDNLLPVIHDIKNTNNTWDGDMVGKYWEMNEDGLTQMIKK